MIKVFIGIGSNIDPEQNIIHGLTLLSRTEKIIRVSNFYQTSAIGKPDDPDFFNGVAAIKTLCDPLELKHSLREIESACGRVRTSDPYAPRPLDLDIVLYGDMVIREGGLVIPDPDIRSRAFIAIPIYEIAPCAVLPDTGEPVSNIIKKSDRSGMKLVADLSKILQMKFQDNHV
ncbi:MAG: 2-amino-4-hydroxy-6-hydroxymethyldihydropteridine diphosphokinase [Desulfobacterales bacterium]|nr:2-amino-4-hydroxy-6-hydroxymethyldihydropteridine diphosphokinase [Desulfobacterales bacterium]